MALAILINPSINSVSYTTQELIDALTHPRECLNYCMKVDKRIPSLEKIILTSPNVCCLYAVGVIKGRWTEAEEDIVTGSNTDYFKLYLDVAEGRLVEIEPLIIASAQKDIYLQYLKGL